MALAICDSGLVRCSVTARLATALCTPHAWRCYWMQICGLKRGVCERQSHPSTLEFTPEAATSKVFGTLFSKRVRERTSLSLAPHAACAHVA